MNEGLLLVLAIIGLAILLIAAAMWFYNKSDTGITLMLMYTMRRHGPNSIITINLLQDIVNKALTREGHVVSDISLAYEMGNRYHAILTIDGEAHQMTVIADNAGTVHYQMIG